MKYLFSLLAVSLLLASPSCKKGTQHIDNKLTEASQNEEAPPPGAAQKSDDQAPVKNGNVPWDKKIVRNAGMNVEVKDFLKYDGQIRELIIKFEGYIAQEEESGSEYEQRNVITIKIPVAHLDNAITAISALQGKVLAKTMSSEDVTGEVFDTRARIEAKKRVRLRYLDMLQKAKNMEEISQVEREINQLQEQIESAEGRLNYLDHSASLSTLQVTFFQVLNPGGTGSSMPGYGQRLSAAFKEGFEWLANIVIIIASVWPLWIILAAVLIIAKRLRLVR